MTIVSVSGLMALYTFFVKHGPLPIQASMQSSMVSVRYDHKILWSVIKSVFVDVMNVLRCGQSSVENLFYHISMFKFPPSTIGNLYKAIWPSVAELNPSCPNGTIGWAIYSVSCYIHCLLGNHGRFVSFCERGTSRPAALIGFRLFAPSFFRNRMTFHGGGYFVSRFDRHFLTFSHDVSFLGSWLFSKLIVLSAMEGSS